MRAVAPSVLTAVITLAVTAAPAGAVTVSPESPVQGTLAELSMSDPGGDVLVCCAWGFGDGTSVTAGPVH